MKKNMILITILLTSLVAFSASRIARYDEVNGGNLRISGNSLISTDTNGDINFTPNGSGLSVFADLTAQSSVDYLNSSSVKQGSVEASTSSFLITGASSSERATNGGAGLLISSGSSTGASGSGTLSLLTGSTTNSNSGTIALKTGISSGGSQGSITLDALDVRSETQITFKELASTPTTPSTGYMSFYPKTDGKLYTVDDAGSEVEVGGAGASPYIKGVNNAGQTITAATTGVTFTETVDADALWSGTDFTADQDGEYRIDGYIFINASSGNTYNAYIDGTKDVVVSSDTSTNHKRIGGVITLLSGEVLTIRSNITVTLSADAFLHHITINKIN